MFSPLPTRSSILCVSAVVIDEGLVAQMVNMGFAVEGCRRAVYHTRSQGIEPAMEWVLQHMEDQGEGKGRGGEGGEEVI